MCVKGPGTLILRMTREGANPGDIRRLEGTAHGVLQQPRAEAASLPC